MVPARRIHTNLFVAMFALAFALLPQTIFASEHSGTGSSVRISQSIDDNQTVRLAHNTRPEANAKNDRGPVSDSFDIDHMFLLLQRSPEKEQALDKLIDQLNDRKSPNFHHWLTAAEFGQRFGVAQEDIDTITNWLESHGFRVNQVYLSRILIDFSGTAGQLREAFHTEMHQLDVNGQMHFSNISDPRIPLALAPVVKGFASLNDFKPRAMYKAKPDYTFAGCASSASVPTEPGTCYAVTPQDNYTIYNLNPLFTGGITGLGQTIAVIEDSDTYNGTGDWTSYRNAFGLSTAYPSGSYTQVHPGGCADPGTNADDGEAAIDVELATAFAPNAAIENISCPSSTVTFGGLIALQNLINGAGLPPAIVSVSYGECEAINGNGGNAAFYNTFQQAAAEGVSVFGATGDGGPSSCSADLTNGTQTEYNEASLSVSGWTETPFNVAVGGTDFEDVYNADKGGTPLSTYWSPTNTSSYGSALQYVPEIPWDDSCANVLISEIAHSTFTTYGSSGTCNTSPFNATSSYLVASAAGGGPSNCATGAGGLDAGADGVSDPQCQGYAKPSWQSGSSLTGGQAVYGQPSDGVRDIPDVSLFAGNGIWGHFETICWSDPSQTSHGAASCSGAPSTWSGLGGTSVASPAMAGIQALVNQQTNQIWGNPNPIYYQIAQNEYGVSGGTFLGGSCNSSGSGGPGSGCAFNDVTQGDIDLACTDNASLEKAHCYLPSGTFGVDSTDVITAATVITGGSGYTAPPTCTIAGPSNSSPYKSPTGSTLYAGGTQATCTAAVSTGTTTAVWTVAVQSTNGAGIEILLAAPGGSPSCGPYTLVGTSATSIASALQAAIASSACSLATATYSGHTVTLTATATGAAGNFITEFGPNTEYSASDVYITNTTKGQGPNYVSGITISVAGSGYQPETPITLTGSGTGAIAVANTSIATAPSTYQPAYGAAPGYDLATGLGTVNAYNLVESSVWTSVTQSSQTINPFTVPANAGYNSTFTVTATSTSGLPVVITSSDSCSGSGYGSGSGTVITMTMTGDGTCSISANQPGDGFYSAAATVTETVTATPGTQTITFTTVPPVSAAYNGSFTVTATGGASGNPVTFTAGGVCSITGMATNSATYTMTSGTGNCSVIADQAGNTYWLPATEVTSLVTALLANQTITLITPAPATAVNGTSFTVVATASSGLPVTYTASGHCTAGLTSGIYTITGTSGQCDGMLSQAGNANWRWAPHLKFVTTINAAVAPIVTFTGQPANATYGDTFVVTASSNETGSEIATPVITASGSCTAGPPTNAGASASATITMSSGSGTCKPLARWAAAGPYSAATDSLAVPAEKAVVVIDWPTPAPITYGTQLSATQLDATASYNSSPVAGTFTYNPAAGSTPRVPTPPATCDTLKVTFVPSSNADYTSEMASVCLVVNPAP